MLIFLHSVHCNCKDKGIQLTQGSCRRHFNKADKLPGAPVLVPCLRSSFLLQGTKLAEGSHVCLSVPHVCFTQKPETSQLILHLPSAHNSFRVGKKPSRPEENMQHKSWDSLCLGRTKFHNWLHGEEVSVLNASYNWKINHLDHCIIFKWFAMLIDCFH